MSATILWYQHAEGGAKHGFAWPFPAVIAEQVATAVMMPCQPPDKEPVDGVELGREPGVVGVRVRKFVRRVPDKDGVEQEVTSFELLDEIPEPPKPESPQERRARLMAELAELDAAEPPVVVPDASPDATQRADLPASGEGPKPARTGARRREE